MAQDAEFELYTPPPQKKRPGKSAGTPPSAKPSAKAEAPPEPETPMLKKELAELIENEPGKALLDQATRAELYREIETAIEKHTPDLTTGVGRKAIASLAYKITRTKTALDAAGKDLNADLRKQIDAVDEVRREARERFDALADKARQPLTDWENDEKRRQEIMRGVLDKIGELVALSERQPSDQLEQRLSVVRGITIDPDIFLDETEAGNEKRDEAISNLAYALNEAQEREEREKELAELRRKQEEDAAELARLKAEREEAQRKEDQARIDREREERQAREAEEQRERDRLAELERVREEERQRAQAAQEAERQAHQQELDRIAEERRKQEAESVRQRQEQESREADAAHKRKVNTAVRNALMETAGLDKEDAQNATIAILGGKIPHITITY